MRLVNVEASNLTTVYPLFIEKLEESGPKKQGTYMKWIGIFAATSQTEAYFMQTTICVFHLTDLVF